jgi:hypothetical protein
MDTEPSPLQHKVSHPLRRNETMYVPLLSYVTKSETLRYASLMIPNGCDNLDLDEEPQSARSMKQQRKLLTAKYVISLSLCILNCNLINRKPVIILKSSMHTSGSGMKSKYDQ